MSEVSIHQAKARLTELVHLAEGGQEVIITRHGRPVAIIQALSQGQPPLGGVRKKPGLPCLDQLPSIGNRNLIRRFLDERE
jgi:prevent-host-death family protein